MLIFLHLSMKCILFLLVIFPVFAFGQAIPALNSFKQFDNTMAVFLDRVVAREDNDSVFTLTTAELKHVFGHLKSQEELDEAYIGYFRSASFAFDMNETPLPYRKIQITDTLTHKLKFRGMHYKVLTLYTYFGDAPIDPSTGKSWSDTYKEFHFILIGDRLKLLYTHSSHAHTDVTGERMDYVEEEAQLNITDPQYKRFNFTGDYYPGRAVPFRKKGKWGFMSPENTVLFPAVCDSVFPGRSGYTMIALNGRYNLLDAGYRRMFAKEVKTIVPGPFYFSSVNAEKLQPLSFFRQFRHEVKLPPDFKASDSIRDIKTAYLFSNDGKNFRPLKPYLEVSKTYIPVSPERQLYPEPKQAEPVVIVKDVPKQPVWQPEYALKNNYNTGAPELTWWTIAKKTGDTIAEFEGWEGLSLWKDVLCGKKGDTTYVMEANGTILMQTHLYGHLQNGCLRIFDPATSLMGAYLLETKKSVPVQYRSIQLHPGSFKVITKDYQFGFLNSNGEELFD